MNRKNVNLFVKILIATANFVTLSGLFQLSYSMDSRESKTQKQNSLTNRPISPVEYFIQELRRENSDFQLDPHFNFYLKSKKFFFGKSNIIKLPEIIGKFTALDVLSLGDNKLTELPETIGLLKNLTFLCLRNNNLTKLPAAFVSLTNLTFVDLDENELTELPDEIGNLLNLTKLPLKNNNLTRLPASIGKLSKLTGLWVEGNKLTKLPEEIRNIMPTLDRLLLHDNALTELPFNFKKTDEVGATVCRIFIEGNPLAQSLGFSILGWSDQ